MAKTKWTKEQTTIYMRCLSFWDTYVCHVTEWCVVFCFFVFTLLLYYPFTRQTLLILCTQCGRQVHF